MVTDLQLLVDDTEEYERPIARLIATTVAYEADTGLKAAKLANDIKFICQAEDIKVKSRSNGSTEGIEEVLSNIWYLVIDIARLTPPNHPRQNCLVEAVEILRQTEGTAPSMGVSEWSDLPDLSLCIRERWNDGKWDPWGEELTENDLQDFEEWKNQNSFTARISTAAWRPSLYLAIWELREGLEKPPVRGKIQETRIWVACEWLLRCTELIFDFIMIDRPQKDTALNTGSLCGPDFPQSGIQRWEFWKKRLQELSNEAESLHVDGSIVERMSEAAKKIDEVKEKRG